MHYRHVARTLLLLALLTSLALPSTHPAAAAPQARPNAAPTPPDLLVPSGVTSYTVAASKAFWYTSHGPCPPDTHHMPGFTEDIQRIAVQGSQVRPLYHQDLDCALYTVKSNVVADADYIYWANDTGLVRLSTEANVGDLPELVSAAPAGSSELTIDSNNVYALRVQGTHPNYTSTIRRINKATNTSTLLASRSGYLISLQVSHSVQLGGGAHDYLYWIEAGKLMRYNLNNGTVGTLVASGMAAFYAEGGRTTCSVICSTTDRVYYSTGTQVSYYNNYSGTSTAVYSSAERVYGLATDANNLFTLEEHAVPCSPEPCIGSTLTDYLRRRDRVSGGTTETLYNSDPGVLASPSQQLTVADGYLLWADEGRLLRLPTNAGALTLSNLRVTGLQITQGIQKPDNSVMLVAGRRTFVRVFVASDGATVPGVTAVLERLNASNQVVDTIIPVNNVGTALTVSTTPQRANLNDSFLFELPWNWISTGLRLRAVLNPYHAPPESSYTNNTNTAGPFTFKTSPALKVQFVAWQYTFNGTTFTPRDIEDLQQTYSWIIRAFPLASKITFDDSNTPGFHPAKLTQADSKLGGLVDQSDPDCQDLLIKNPDGTTKSDDRNLCASRYTNFQMGDMRDDNGHPASRFYYGMISDGLKFPRGQACCAANVSTGPSGSGTWGWDTDGSYADWYAAHEIGHTLGRGHPDKGNTCGHSADASYPYANAQIGPNDDTEGFDAGDEVLGIPRAVYPGTQWFDVMSYCDNQWISDHTYTAMYDYMIANPSAAAASPAAVQVAGDFLKVYGSIIASANRGSIVSLRHVGSSSATAAAQTLALPVNFYVIRLLDAGGAELARSNFTPTGTPEGEAGVLSFSQTVNYVAGTRQVQLLSGDGTVLDTVQVSSSAPLVGGVTLGGSRPLTGTATLNWTASDPDGDALSFTIRSSDDGGATFQTLQSGLTGTSATIDANQLAGGSLIFQVEAHDGAHSASADSAPVTVAAKPPVPLIVLPRKELQIHYGQLVNFSGTAFDLQDGGVAESNLIWRDNGVLIGRNAQISTKSLKVGQHVITLTATNSRGLSASASVTVHVDDDLRLPGPTLTAGPDRFNWQFAANATGALAKTLHVGNAGSGSLNWSASTNVPWLSLSRSSGTGSGDIVLTASPQGISNGSSLNGTLTLTASVPGAARPQTIVIPVSLSKGANVYQR